MTSYSPYQFAAFRILFGCYLACSFGSVIPYGKQLFGDTPIGHTAATYPFPDVFSLGDGIVPIEAFLFGLVIMAILFTLGVMRRLVALLIWYGLACLLHQNNAIFNVSTAYVGWLLLACALIPGGEPFRLSLRSSTKEWRMPPLIFLGAWIVMAVGYSISGHSKLEGETWLDGTALIQLMNHPGARDWWLTRAMASTPRAIGYALTWSVVCFELGFIVFCLHRITRAIAWTSLVVMHLAILLLMAGTEVQLAMLLFHLFTFDRRWLNGRLPALSGQSSISST